MQMHRPIPCITYLFLSTSILVLQNERTLLAYLAFMLSSSASALGFIKSCGFICTRSDIFVYINQILRLKRDGRIVTKMNIYVVVEGFTRGV